MNHWRAPLNAELSVNTISLFSEFQDSYFYLFQFQLPYLKMRMKNSYFMK